MSRNQIHIEFASKTPFAGGVSFGNAGPYERLLGTASFAIDPNEKDLPFICDLEFAPRNPEGLVEFKTILDIVKPVDLSKGNRKLLFDFSNRGGRGAFTRLERRRRTTFRRQAPPATVFSIGKATRWSLPAGRATWFTTAAMSWRSCRKRARTASRCAVKCARNLSPIRKACCRCRSAARRTFNVIPCSTAPTATLTMREKEADPRVTVPASDWELAKAKEIDGKSRRLRRRIPIFTSKADSRPGWIYELIYDTEGSRVMGLGFLGLRDLVSFLRHDGKGFWRRIQSAGRRDRQGLRLRRIARRPGRARVRLRRLEPRRRRTQSF